jgi:hypothetical protein
VKDSVTRRVHSKRRKPKMNENPQKWQQQKKEKQKTTHNNE